LAPDAGGCPDGFQGKPGGPPHHEGDLLFPASMDSK